VISLEELVGSRGFVTITIHGPLRAGEVCLPCNGGTQTFLAYANEEIPQNAAVFVYGTRPGGVEVTKA
jgi:hypothetical protein